MAGVRGQGPGVRRLSAKTYRRLKLLERRRFRKLMIHCRWDGGADYCLLDEKPLDLQRGGAG